MRVKVKRDKNYTQLVWHKNRIDLKRFLWSSMTIFQEHLSQSIPDNISFQSPTMNLKGKRFCPRRRNILNWLKENQKWGFHSASIISVNHTMCWAGGEPIRDFFILIIYRNFGEALYPPRKFIALDIRPSFRAEKPAHQNVVWT